MWKRSIFRNFLVILHLSVPCSGLSIPSSTPTNRKLGLITFDLDDTLFPILPVVQEANEAMFRSLSEFGYDDASEEGYHSACKQLRKELYENMENANPITYSELRRRGIYKEMQACSQNDPTKKRNKNGSTNVVVKDMEIVEHAFEAWLSERHASAEKHLFATAIPMLECIQKEHPHAFIVAVTNGRGSPMFMPNTIKPYFHSCVSGEDDDVFPFRKPHPGIFEATLSKTFKQQQKDGKNALIKDKNGKIQM